MGNGRPKCAGAMSDWSYHWVRMGTNVFFTLPVFARSCLFDHKTVSPFIIFFPARKFYEIGKLYEIVKASSSHSMVSNILMMNHQLALKLIQKWHKKYCIVGKNIFGFWKCLSIRLEFYQVKMMLVLL